MGRAIIANHKTPEEAKAYLEGFFETLRFEGKEPKENEYSIYYEPDMYPDKPYTINQD